ncbi:MAG: STAS domain-containing protein [Thermoleophilia bacterium]|nr:STAS domain-containing protein [Thermoleophilia bacterium]
MSRVDGVAIASLAGSFDIYSLPALRGELDALAGTTPLVVDLSEVTLIDSSGLSALLSLANRCARSGPVPFGLVCPRRRLRRVFEITGLRDAFAIGADLAAVRAIWEAGGGG